MIELNTAANSSWKGKLVSDLATKNAETLYRPPPASLLSNAFCEYMIVHALADGCRIEQSTTNHREATRSKTPAEALALVASAAQRRK